MTDTPYHGLAALEERIATLEALVNIMAQSLAHQGTIVLRMAQGDPDATLEDGGILIDANGQRLGQAASLIEPGGHPLRGKVN